MQFVQKLRRSLERSSMDQFSANDSSLCIEDGSIRILPSFGRLQRSAQAGQVILSKLGEGEKTTALKGKTNKPSVWEWVK